MRTYGCALALFLVFTNLSFAQDIPELTAKDSIVTSSWIIGIGVNVVEDTGQAPDDVFDLKDSWNIAPFPSRLSIGRYFSSGIGIEGIATYSKLQQGNFIDGFGVLAQDEDYYAFDTRLSYDLNKIIGQTSLIDPYVGVGLGFSKTIDESVGTYNGVLGFRIWFSDHWGLDLNTSGKWAFGTNARNHVQHGAGVLYQFDIEKGLSKKGKEKLTLIQQIQQENQRIQDSIASARQIEAEASALAERMAREKKAAAIKAAEEAELARKKELENKIKGLGEIYFAFNSSSLNNESKMTLDQLAEMMLENQSVKLQVNAHTDSRGPELYNQGLSQRRADVTVGYLISKGIAEDRLESNGYGETRLVNHCSEEIFCTAKEHQANRRSEFLVLEL